MQKANLSHSEHDCVKYIHQCKEKKSPISHSGTIMQMNHSVFCLCSATNISDKNVRLETMTMTLHFCLTEADPRQ